MARHRSAAWVRPLWISAMALTAPWAAGGIFFGGPESGQDLGSDSGSPRASVSPSLSESYVEIAFEEEGGPAVETLLWPSNAVLRMASGEGRRVERLRVGDALPMVRGGIGRVIRTGPAMEASRASGSAHRVLGTIAHTVRHLTTITTSTGPLRTTPNHRFRLADAGWVPASSLKPGDRLVPRDGSLSRPEVIAITTREVPPTRVYNLTVEGHHTYFVGDDGVLVHNTPTCTRVPPPASSLEEDALQQITLSKFETGRNLYDYLEAFPPSLATKLANLGPDDHWVDMGAGAGIALGAYGAPRVTPPPHKLPRDSDPQVMAALRTIEEKAPGERAQATGITKQVLAPTHFQWVPFPGSGNLIDAPEKRPTMLTGKFLHEYEAGTIPKADVITDYFGVFAYDPHPDQVLKTYHQLLKDKGEAFIFVGSEDFGFAARSQVELPSGDRVTLRDWVLHHPDFETTFESSMGASRNARRPSLAVAHLRKRPGGSGEGTATHWGSLTMVSSDLGAPPSRRFVMEAPPPPEPPRRSGRFSLGQGSVREKAEAGTREFLGMGRGWFLSLKERFKRSLGERDGR